MSEALRWADSPYRESFCVLILSRSRLECLDVDEEKKSKEEKKRGGEKIRWTKMRKRGKLRGRK
jgi:hypothetical protein